MNQTFRPLRQDQIDDLHSQVMRAKELAPEYSEDEIYGILNKQLVDQGYAPPTDWQPKPEPTATQRMLVDPFARDVGETIAGTERMFGGDQRANEMERYLAKEYGSQPKNIAERVVAGGAGMLPELATSFVNPVAGIAAFAGGGGAKGYESGYEQAKQAGANEDVARKAAREEATLNAGLGIIPGFGAMRAAKPVTEAVTEAVLPRLAKSVGRNALIMGGYGAGGQLGSNVIAENTYDPNRPITQNVLPAGFESGLTGAVTLTPVEALHGRFRRATQLHPETNVPPIVQPPLPEVNPYAQSPVEQRANNIAYLNAHGFKMRDLQAMDNATLEQYVSETQQTRPTLASKLQGFTVPQTVNPQGWQSVEPKVTYQLSQETPSGRAERIAQSRENITHRPIVEPTPVTPIPMPPEGMVLPHVPLLPERATSERMLNALRRSQQMQGTGYPLVTPFGETLQGTDVNLAIARLESAIREHPEMIRSAREGIPTLPFVEPLEAREAARMGIPTIPEAQELPPVQPLTPAQLPTIHVPPVQPIVGQRGEVTTSSTPIAKAKPSEPIAKTWYRGVNAVNETPESGDKFYSASKDVADNYSITETSDKPRIETLKVHPKNPLVVDDKQTLSDQMGYEGDPLAEPLNTPLAQRFDTIAKQYAKSLGHDAIVYQNGTFGEPELHLFGDKSVVPSTIERRTIGEPVKPVSGETVKREMSPELKTLYDEQARLEKAKKGAERDQALSKVNKQIKVLEKKENRFAQPEVAKEKQDVPLGILKSNAQKAFDDHYALVDQINMEQGGTPTPEQQTKLTALEGKVKGFNDQLTARGEKPFELEGLRPALGEEPARDEVRVPQVEQEQPRSDTPVVQPERTDSKIEFDITHPSLKQESQREIIRLQSIRDLLKIKLQQSRTDGGRLLAFGNAVNDIIGQGALRPTAQEISKAAEVLGVSITDARKALDYYSLGEAPAIGEQLPKVAWNKYKHLTSTKPERTGGEIEPPVAKGSTPEPTPDVSQRLESQPESPAPKKAWEMNPKQYRDEYLRISKIKNTMQSSNEMYDFIGGRSDQVDDSRMTPQQYSINKALEKGNLIPEKYNELHAKYYGKYGSDEFRKNFPDVKVEKTEGNVADIEKGGKEETEATESKASEEPEEPTWDQRVTEAKARFKNGYGEGGKIKPSGGFVDPKVLDSQPFKDLAIIGADYVKRGASSLADFGKAVKSEFDQFIKDTGIALSDAGDYLKELYKQSTASAKPTVGERISEKIPEGTKEYWSETGGRTGEFLKENLNPSPNVYDRKTSGEIYSDSKLAARAGLAEQRDINEYNNRTIRDKYQIPLDKTLRNTETKWQFIKHVWNGLPEGETTGNAKLDAAIREVDKLHQFTAKRITDTLTKLRDLSNIDAVPDLPEHIFNVIYKGSGKRVSEALQRMNLTTLEKKEQSKTLTDTERSRLAQIRQTLARVNPAERQAIESFLRSHATGNAGAGFLMHKVITSPEMLRLVSDVGGVKLRYDNPIELQLAVNEAQNRYLSHVQILNELQGLGLVHIAGSKDAITKNGKTKLVARELPEDMVKSNMQLKVIKGGMDANGYDVWAKPETARILNNIASPSLFSKTGFGKALSDVSHILLSGRLALSMFHPAFILNETLSTALAEGKLKGMAIKPLLDRGREIQKADMEYNEGLRNSLSASLGKKPEVIDALLKAGGQAMESRFDNTPIARVIGKLGTQEIFKRIQQIKLGTWDMVRVREREILAKKLGRELTENELRQADTRAWDSIDNRMGLMVEDNLFLHRYVRNIAHLSMLSPTWNIGSLAEMKGALSDIGHGQVNTARVRWMGAQLATTMLFSAVVQKLFTGEDPEGKDFLFPKFKKDSRGDWVRLNPPSYAKDYYHFLWKPVVKTLEGEPTEAVTDIMDTFSRKLNPALSDLYRLATNKDYYGTEIAHPDDPFLQRQYERAMYLARSSLPFSMQGAARNVTRNANWKATDIVLPFLGANPAPKSIEQTNAEELAGKYLKAMQSSEPRTKEQFDKTQARYQIQDLLRQRKAGGNATQINDQIATLRNSYNLTTLDMQRASREYQHTPLENAMNRFDPDKALKVLEVTEPSERTPHLIQQVRLKIANSKASVKDKQQWRDQLSVILKNG